MEALKVGGAQTKAKQVLARRVARYLRLATCNAEGLRIAPDDAREIVAEAMERSESEEGRAKALSLSKEYHRDELIYEEEMRGKDFVRSADALDALPAAETFARHMRTIKPITLIRLLVVAIRGMDRQVETLLEVLHQVALEIDAMGDGAPDASDGEAPEAEPDDERTVRTKKRFLRRQEQEILDKREKDGYQTLDADASKAFDASGFAGQLRRKTTASPLKVRELRRKRGQDADVPDDERDEPAKPERRATRRATKLNRKTAGKGGAGWMRELDALDAKKLMDAASVGQTAVVERFILRSVRGAPGAPPVAELFGTVHPQLGYTALHAAVDFERADCARLMLKHGADPNTTKARHRQTPLHIAAAGARVEIVKMLRAHGADNAALDAHYKRAFELVPEEACKDPAVLAMRESLKDGPDRIESCHGKGVAARQFTMAWESLGQADVFSAAAATQFYRVDWEQPARRKTSPCYTTTLRAHTLPDRFLIPPSKATEGTKLRHVRRKNRVLDFNQWDMNTRGAVHKTEYHDEETELVVAGLYPATRYVATVRASNAAGLGPLSPAVYVWTLPDICEIPSEPFLVHTTAANVVVAWLPPRYDNGKEVESYELQRYIVGGTRADKWRRLTKVHGTGKKLNEAMAELATRTRPDGEADDDPNTWACAKNHKDPGWTNFRFRAAERPIFNFPGLSRGDRVVCRVRAANEVGWSGYSRLSCCFVAEPSIRVLDIDARSLVVEWDTHTLDAECWELQRQTNRITGRCDPWECVVDDIPHVRNGKVKFKVEYGLGPGCSYRFRVRPKDVYGWRDWDTPLMTDVVRLLEDVPDPPAAPKGNTEACTATTVELDWAPGFGNGQPVTRFELQYIPCVDEHDTWDGATTVELTGLQTNFTLKNVKTGALLSFRVRAYNKHGWSDWSLASLPVSTSTILPPGVPFLRETGTTWIDVQWAHAPNGNVVKYVVQYQVAGNATWATHRDDEVRDNHAIIPDLKPGGRYIFRVQALTLDGFSVFTESSEELRCRRRF